MLRNSLRRVLPALAMVAIAVTLMGCPPPEEGTRGAGNGDGNGSEAPGPSADEDESAQTESQGEGETAQTTGQGEGETVHTDSQEAREMGIVSSTYGSTQDGKEVTEWTLTNANGMRVQLMDFGASVLSVEVPDRDGNFDNVTLAFDTFEGFEGKHDYFGATVGRYANRIALGSFELDGTVYDELSINNPPNTLHGGEVGFNKVMWSGEQFEDSDNYGVRFTYVSPDGEEGYPGELTCSSTYSLSKKTNQLTFSFDATTDAPTVVNLANHSYWNLSGNSRDPENTILDQELQILADQYLPVDDTLIPTGELADVEGTPFDFREAKPIGQDIEELRGEPEGSPNPGCYDHNWVLREPYGDYSLRAVLYDPETGRKMQMYSVEPGVQFYTGNFLAGDAGQNAGYHQHAGLCLEFQHWPDSPNQPEFPSARLDPGEEYHSETIHLFSVE